MTFGLPDRRDRSSYWLGLGELRRQSRPTCEMASHCRPHYLLQQYRAVRWMARPLLVVIVGWFSSGSSVGTTGTDGRSSSCGCSCSGSWTQVLACSSIGWLISDCVRGPDSCVFVGSFRAPSGTVMMLYLVLLV